ncbi:MAG: hypothetical protein JSR33_06245, partial [Proteobacteria bacterium]|nr:hypothetical protein [Pseudomonadota bacterium]
KLKSRLKAREFDPKGDLKRSTPVTTPDDDKGKDLLSYLSSQRQEALKVFNQIEYDENRNITERGIYQFCAYVIDLITKDPFAANKMLKHDHYNYRHVYPFRSQLNRLLDFWKSHQETIKEHILFNKNKPGESAVDIYRAIKEHKSPIFSNIPPPGIQDVSLVTSLPVSITQPPGPKYSSAPIPGMETALSTLPEPLGVLTDDSLDSKKLPPIGVTPGYEPIYPQITTEDLKSSLPVQPSAPPGVTELSGGFARIYPGSPTLPSAPSDSTYISQTEFDAINNPLLEPTPLDSKDVVASTASSGVATSLEVLLSSMPAPPTTLPGVLSGNPSTLVGNTKSRKTNPPATIAQPSMISA